MKQIKIQKEFWDKIVSGEKKFEFRKLEKGITTGTYEFVVDNNLELCNCGSTTNTEYMSDHSKNCNMFGASRILGTVKLTPIEINPKFVNLVKCLSTSCSRGEWCDYDENTHKNQWYWFSRSDVEKYESEDWDSYFDFEEEYYCGVEVDDETYDFVKENYIDKNIDFVIYKISEVKENNGKN